MKKQRKINLEKLLFGDQVNDEERAFIIISICQGTNKVCTIRVKYEKKNPEAKKWRKDLLLKNVYKVWDCKATIVAGITC